MWRSARPSAPDARLAGPDARLSAPPPPPTVSLAARSLAALTFAGLMAALPRLAHAQPREVVFVDRVVVRFTSPETGGIVSPRFVFERELAFEARLEALTDGNFRASETEPYVDRHVRSALERHMAEVLLGSLEITPEPTAKDLESRMRAARLSLAQQVGGQVELAQASLAEGIDSNELDELLRRRARASLYLDRMVATMLTPTDTELRIVHRTTRTPFSSQPFEDVAPLLSRWYVAQRLNAAVRAFYEGARSRIKVSLPAQETALPP
jgi:hypothetical protein